jgi:cytidyltransferase-like protein
MKTKQKEIIVAVSGGFDPIHPGHIQLFREAKALGDKLVVIINNDNWLKAKKGHPFMSQKERKIVIEALRDVDAVMVTEHKSSPKDMGVAKELRLLQPDIFANGGDRKKDNTPEGHVCSELGIKMIFGIGKGGKIQSSSWLLGNYVDKVQKKK